VLIEHNYINIEGEIYFNYNYLKC